MSTTYYPNYKPHNLARFEEMLMEFRKCETVETFHFRILIFGCDMTIHREDITVALTRVAREKGFKV